MARVKKQRPTLGSIVFATPEQKVLRYLLSEPTTAFTPRVISSKLKGVRGLGGLEGITRILHELEEAGMVEFLDNRKSVRLHDDHPGARILKSFTALCDLDDLKEQLAPISSKVILYGSRAEGRSASDSTYEILVVSDTPEEARKIAARHPLGKLIVLETRTPDEYHELDRRGDAFAQKLSRGIVVYGSTW